MDSMISVFTIAILILPDRHLIMPMQINANPYQTLLKEWSDQCFHYLLKHDELCER